MGKSNKYILTTAITGLLSFSSITAMATDNPLVAEDVSTNSRTTEEGKPKSNQFWWPEQLDLSQLRDQGIKSNPYGDDFNYAEEFKTLDLATVKKDINDLLVTSQDWWPSDYGNYGPFFIRMAWHSAGTYRTHDGRGGAGGGQQRFNPLNSWPDNASLDKARRLLWPIKQKYGRKLSWADLMILTGNVSMENMGFKTLGFAGGRADDWEADLVYWGPETKFLGAERRTKDGKLEKPLAAVQMGLIYVNPEGPNANHDPLDAAKDIRESFGRMAMNNEEIVALIAGGHTFGKAHGAHKPNDCLGAEPGGAPIEDQGFGWKNKCGKGNAEDTITSGLEGAWTSAPAQWTHMYLDNLLKFEWKQAKSPAGAVQWIPTDESAKELVPDAHIEGKFHAPIMFTTDLAMKRDAEFRKISERFHENPKEFEQAFARAWFKLTHRDMGPKARYIGSEVPDLSLSWQDPLPEIDHKLLKESHIEDLKERILESDLTIPELTRTVWASASSYRDTDMRGGANGARINLEPQRSWEVNGPEELSKALSTLDNIRKEFNEDLFGDRKVSLADTIVIAGSAAIEKAFEEAGYKDVSVPVMIGRADATQEQTDVESFNYLKPTADAFRNYYNGESYRGPAEMMVDKADMLGLTVPEMTVLIGGMRVLNANVDGSKNGVLTKTPGQLNNAFFVNLLDMSTIWQKSKENEGLYEGIDRKSGETKWSATTVDLIYGSNSELRAVAEVYASEDSKQKFADDFVGAWTKVMNADRFDEAKDI